MRPIDFCKPPTYQAPCGSSIPPLFTEGAAVDAAWLASALRRARFALDLPIETGSERLTLHDEVCLVVT